MRPRRLTALGCAAAAAAALAAPAGASAAKAPKFDQAEFSASLSGSQVTTWESHDPRDTNDPCDTGYQYYGDQSIQFTAPKFKLRVYDTSEEPDLFGTDGRPSIATTPGILYATAKAERNGDTSFEPQVSNNCPGDNGGGVKPDTRPKDCGTRTGRFNPHLFFHTEASADDDLFVPITPPDTSKDKDNLKLGGRLYEWSGPAGKKTNLDSTFENCPWTLGEAWQEREGQIFISHKKVREAALFNKRKRSFVISGHAIVPRSGEKTTGKTIVAWNLRLKRVK